MTLIISEKEKIENTHIAILGLGGLGGYILEYALRLGFKHISIIDYDIIEESNLNRQILSSEKNIGNKKIDVAIKRAESINSKATINYFHEKFDESNSYKILKNIDIAFDGFDNLESRIIAVESCEKLNIPFIYGSVYSFYGMVSTIMPKNNTLEIIYKNYNAKKYETQNETVSFLPPLVASIQMSEATKLILGKGDIFENKIFTINTLENKYNTLSIL